MSVIIRLQRGGNTNRPHYRVVVSDNRRPRDGRFIEHIGTYDPLPENYVLDLNLERYNYWIANGAQASDRVQWLFLQQAKGEKADLGVKRVPVKKGIQPEPEPKPVPKVEPKAEPKVEAAPETAPEQATEAE